MSVAKMSSPNSGEFWKLEGKDPVDQPVLWAKLFRAMGQPELPGWPLLSPVKVQMQKCDKCNREFFSSINCRRHIRVHHRLKNLDKNSGKFRERLGSFWSKLSGEEAMEIVSFKNLTFEGVAGATIIKNLASRVLRPGISHLPQACNIAGAALLDIIQARPSTFPLSAQEFFRILDDASEETFLFGSALSLSKYIFDGEAAKIVPEAKNLVACTSFFLELQLVKAWIDYRDAEALRCHKLLVEEEEAEQRKIAEDLERNRQKKLRQKAGDKSVEEERDHLYNKLESPKAKPSAESSGNFATDQVASSVEMSRNSLDDEEVKVGPGFDCIDPGISQNIEQKKLQGDSYKKSGHGVWKVSSWPSVYASWNSAIRFGSFDPETGNDEIGKSKVAGEAFPEDGPNKKRSILTGSVPVTVEGFRNLLVQELERQKNDLLLSEMTAKDDGAEDFHIFCRAARDFHVKRWAEAISGDHLMVPSSRG